MAVSHPKRNKVCAFCNYWVGNAKMELVDTQAGFKNDSRVMGKCLKNKGAARVSGGHCVNDYMPSVEAGKLL